MKILLALSVVSLAIASDFQMNIEENGEQFVEKIKVDVAGQTEEIKVPAHQDRVEVDILNDFNVGLQAMKIVKEKECLISAIDASEERPAKMKESLRLAQSKFPYDHYTVRTDRSLRVREMSSDEVGEKIAKHCKGNKLIFTVKVARGEAEQTMLRIVKERRARSKRDLTIKKFITCNYLSVNVVETCPPNKLGAQCTFYRTDQRICAYRVTCTPKVTSSGAFAADCTGDHKYNLKQCCDFVCL